MTLLNKFKYLADIPIQTSLVAEKNPYGVSIDDVTVSVSHFARRCRRKLPIIIALSISYDEHILCVAESASDKGHGLSTTK